MLVLMENAAESILSEDFQLIESAWFGERTGLKGTDRRNAGQCETESLSGRLWPAAERARVRCRP